MQKPFISVCIPAYKQPDSLKRLLDSLKNQLFTDFEVIISDDSPDDSVRAVADDYKDVFPLSYYRNQIAKGSPENWNEAVKHANGGWIKIIHHDDWLTKADSLQRFADAAKQHPDADFFFCRSMIFNTVSGNEFLYPPDQKKLAELQSVPAHLFHANLIGAPSATMYRNGLGLTYNPQLIWLVDIEFYTRVILSHRIYHIPEALITTAAESEQQLTTSLKDNVAVELNEYLMSYFIFRDRFDALNLKIMRQGLLFLLQTFKLKSMKDVRESGYTGKIPAFMRIYFTLSAISQPLAIKFLGKWVQHSV